MTTDKQDAALQAISDFGQQWEQLENARLIIEKQAHRIDELEQAMGVALEAIESFKLPEESIVGAQSGNLVLRVPLETIQKQAAALTLLKEVRREHA